MAESLNDIHAAFYVEGTKQQVAVELTTDFKCRLRLMSTIAELTKEQIDDLFGKLATVSDMVR